MLNRRSFFGGLIAFPSVVAATTKEPSEKCEQPKWMPEWGLTSELVYDDRFGSKKIISISSHTQPLRRELPKSAIQKNEVFWEDKFTINGVTFVHSYKRMPRVSVAEYFSEGFFDA